MSIYSEISQEVGWQRQTPKPVNIAEANELLAEVNNGSKEAFKKVLTLHRFMIIDNITKEQEEAFKIVEAAFSVGKEMWQ